MLVCSLDAYPKILSCEAVLVVSIEMFGPYFWLFPLCAMRPFWFWSWRFRAQRLKQDFIFWGALECEAISLVIDFCLLQKSDVGQRKLNKDLQPSKCASSRSVDSASMMVPKEKSLITFHDCKSLLVTTSNQVCPKDSSLSYLVALQFRFHALN